MARGRMVNTTIATDKRLAGLSIESEYLYIKTIPHIDRDGLILGDAAVLWAKVAPRRPELLAGTEDLIQEWIAAQLVVAYDTADGRVLFFPGFTKNQTGMRYEREPASTLPPPPGYDRTSAGIVPVEQQQTSGTMPEDIRQPSGNLPSEVKLREEKLREHPKGDAPAPEPPAASPTPPATAGPTASSDPLSDCIAYLQQPKANKPGAVGRLYSIRYGARYPPDYARLGALAKQLSGDYTALAEMIWRSTVPEGDPHDYLQGCVNGTQARKGGTRKDGSNGRTSIADSRHASDHNREPNAAEQAAIDELRERLRQQSAGETPPA